jgi:DNA-directed RNA polymerase sigma subunit (sigma70/sigma32)
MTGEDREQLSKDLHATIRRLLEQIKESESLVDSGREQIEKTKRMLHDVDAEQAAGEVVFDSLMLVLHIARM